MTCRKSDLSDLRRNCGQHRTRKAATVMLMLVLLVTGAALAAAVKDKYDLRVKWGPDYRTLSFNFLGQQCEYPRDVVKGAFPPAGVQPQFHFEKNWPVVAMSAKWTASVEGWAAKYRPEAIDLILMHACDAQLYENIYPDIIRSSRFTFPPEYLTEAKNPEYNLAAAMCGKEVGYKVTARAGLGAADYEIKTRIRIGLSADGKTVFIHDKPDYISKHLTKREFFFAGHDAGDYLHFEAKMLCLCAPRRLLRGEAMRRVEADSKYLVQRIYEDLDDAPTVEEIEEYLDMVKQGHHPVHALLKKR